MLSTFVSKKIKPVAYESQPAIDCIIEQSLSRLLETKGQNFVANQRDQFFHDYGKVFSGDLFFEDRMNYFNAALVQQHDPELSTALMHSLFRIKRVSKTGLVVNDLLFDCERILHATFDGNLTAFDKGSLFQAYIFIQDANLFLTNAVIFHPQAVLKITRKKLKLERASAHFQREKFLMWLSHREILYSRHTKISPVKIYSEEIYPSGLPLSANTN